VPSAKSKGTYHTIQKAIPGAPCRRRLQTLDATANVLRCGKVRIGAGGTVPSGDASPGQRHMSDDRKLRMGMVGGGVMRSSAPSTAWRRASTAGSNSWPAPCQPRRRKPSPRAGISVSILAATTHLAGHDRGGTQTSAARARGLVSIVTPNDTHFPIAEALVRPASMWFATSPWCTPRAGPSLIQAVREADTVFAVTTTTAVIHW